MVRNLLPSRSSDTSSTSNRQTSAEPPHAVKTGSASHPFAPDALRLALGSLLHPVGNMRRQYPYTSRPSSGTESPANWAHFPSSPPPPPHPTPAIHFTSGAHTHHQPPAFGHNTERHHEMQSHDHHSHSSTPPSTPACETPPMLDGHSSCPTGRPPNTPRATYIDTLNGKSPWDALIHGSFS
ncbi:hypothetical protein FISHEDRAFT_73558 [Fistulina hepatica ATCC 64428]|uniref:Uncharacterized protein n=1 Tax=Fistulina hepatica ATCC 64428 TaxID=1128425 RepID=A0A0D7ACL8_9AGAR|nr:hypothetical protein FISHEDRAFT_73558 [Fistulina hepatica ATCC 64428]